MMIELSKDYMLHYLGWEAINTIIFITITILTLICVTVLFLVFPSKVDAKDDNNSQLPKSKIGNHNVYQCDLETLLHAEKINDNVRLKVHSKKYRPTKILSVLKYLPKNITYYS